MPPPRPRSQSVVALGVRSRTNKRLRLPRKSRQHLLVRLLAVRIVLKAVKRRLAVVAVVAFAPLKLKREVTRFRRSKDQPASRPRNSAARKGAARDVVTTASPSLNSWLDVSL